MSKIKIIKSELLSDNHYVLNKMTYEFEHADGTIESNSREVYDRGNGAAILLYNKKNQTVIVTRQLRLPTFVNGNKSGFMIEVCAGLLDTENPEENIRREAEEETGYRLSRVEKVFQAYMSPGVMTEILHFYIAEYDAEMKISEGGGLAEEQENIEVIEMKFDAAIAMIPSGEIQDAKTIMLIQYAQINKIFE